MTDQPTPTTFSPVPVRARHDGWTAARQAAFVAALAECPCVDTAARKVGMTARTAYRLRTRADAGAFADAWDRALGEGAARLTDGVVARALHGEATPIMYRGRQVGERRRYDNRLAMFLLRTHQPERYGHDAATAPRDPAVAFQAALAALRAAPVPDTPPAP